MDYNESEFESLFPIPDQDFYDANLPRLLIPNQNHIPGPLVNHFPPSPASGTSAGSYLPMPDPNMDLNDGGYTTSPMNGPLDSSMAHSPNNNPLAGPSDLSHAQNIFMLDLKRLQRTILRNATLGPSHVAIMKRKLKEASLGWETMFDQLAPVDDPPRSPRPMTRAVRKNSKHEKFKCAVCPNHHVFRDRGSFRRHFVDLHQAPEIYRCPFCHDLETGRRDKARLHLAQRHGVHEPTKEQLNQMAVPTDAPYQCEVCGILYQSWEKYFECIRIHCQVPGQPSPTAPPRDDDDDDYDYGNNDDDFNNGGGGSGFNDTMFTGNSYNGAGFQSYQFSQGNFTHTYGADSGYNYYHHRGNSGEQGFSECDFQDLDIHSSCSSGCFSRDVGDTTALNPESLATPENHQDVLSSLEKVLPLRPKGVSALSRALQEPQSKEPTGLGPPRQDTTSGRGILPTQPDQTSCPDDDDGLSGSCRSCNHTFNGCSTCRLQKQFGERCHACADGISLPQSGLAERLRVNIPNFNITSNGRQTQSLVYPLPSSNKCDTSVFDVVIPSCQKSSDCMEMVETSEKEIADTIPWELASSDPMAEAFLEKLNCKDYLSDDSTSPTSHHQSWDLVSVEYWTPDNQAPPKTGDDISLLVSAMVHPLGAPHSNFPGDVFVDRLNRGAMLSDPAVRIMMPFMFFYGSGSKADVGHNVLPNAALHGTSYIVQQMQHQQPDARLLQDAATSVTRLISHKRSSRLRKKLQVVAQVLARYASVANANQTNTQAVARKDSLDFKPTGQASDVIEVSSYGLDAQAFLKRVYQILYCLNPSMIESFASPEYTNPKSEDDDEKFVMAFFLHVLMVVLQIPGRQLLTTGMISC